MWRTRFVYLVANDSLVPPKPGGAEYVAICVPAFSMEHVHRDEA
jgi:hypothetical protein